MNNVIMTLMLENTEILPTFLFWNKLLEMNTWPNAEFSWKDDNLLFSF